MNANDATRVKCNCLACSKPVGTQGEALHCDDRDECLHRARIYVTPEFRTTLKDIQTAFIRKVC